MNLIIPYSVIFIGDNAFEDCSSLANLMFHKFQFSEKAAQCEIDADAAQSSNACAAGDYT